MTPSLLVKLKVPKKLTWLQTRFILIICHHSTIDYLGAGHVTPGEVPVKVCVSAGGTESDSDLNHCSSITICFHSLLTAFILLETEGKNWNLKCCLSKLFCLLRLLQLALWVMELVGRAEQTLFWVCAWRWYTLRHDWFLRLCVMCCWTIRSTLMNIKNSWKLILAVDYSFLR